MKKIVVLDTWVNDSNLGNQIIMDSVQREVRSLFPDDIHYSVPALEFIHAGRALIRGADLVLLGGTNVLSANMRRTSEWRVRLTDVRWLQGVVLFGVGWWQYQSSETDRWTRFLLHRILSNDRVHSVRDSYTADRLRRIGIEALNTSCPSTWPLTPEHCREIPRAKADRVVLTFTEYGQDRVNDARLVEAAVTEYSEVLFWPQQHGDYEYAMSFGNDAIRYLSPHIQSLDQVLAEGNVDYLGTRLHAGIRALQKRCRAIIVQIDNRATEMARDINLRVIDRTASLDSLRAEIQSENPIEVVLPLESIQMWKDQFS